MIAVEGANDGSSAAAESYSPEARCSELDPVLSSRRQRDLCRRSFRTLVVLAQGAGIAIEGTCTVQSNRQQHCSVFFCAVQSEPIRAYAHTMNWL